MNSVAQFRNPVNWRADVTFQPRVSVAAGPRVSDPEPAIRGPVYSISA